jgi:hypothetical protein
MLSGDAILAWFCGFRREISAGRFSRLLGVGLRTLLPRTLHMRQTGSVIISAHYYFQTRDKVDNVVKRQPPNECCVSFTFIARRRLPPKCISSAAVYCTMSAESCSWEGAHARFITSELQCCLKRVVFIASAIRHTDIACRRIRKLNDVNRTSHARL